MSVMTRRTEFVALAGGLQRKIKEASRCSHTACAFARLLSPNHTPEVLDPAMWFTGKLILPATVMNLATQTTIYYTAVEAMLRRGGSRTWLLREDTGSNPCALL